MLDLGLLARPIERVPTVDARSILSRPVGGCLDLGLLVYRMIVGELEAVMDLGRADAQMSGDERDPQAVSVRCFR